MQRRNIPATLLLATAREHRGQGRYHGRRQPSERTASGGARLTGGFRRSHCRPEHNVRAARKVPPAKGEFIGQTSFVFYFVVIIDQAWKLTYDLC